MDIRKNGWPPRFAPETAISPRDPSIMESIAFTPKLITFCIAIGIVIANTVLKNSFSKRNLSFSIIYLLIST